MKQLIYKKLRVRPKNREIQQIRLQIMMIRIGEDMTMKVIVLNLVALAFFAQSVIAGTSRDALIDAQMKTGEKVNAEQGNSLSDQKGRVYQIDGKAMITRQGSPVESKLKVGDLVQVGDAIYTKEKSSVSITFDYLKKNAVHIPESSRAVFNSIEPTDIKLENGSVFNAVEGLPQGSTWKVTTPVAVAAVRGTVYLVRFETATGEFYAATVDVPDDGRNSAIDIQLIERDGLANVPEGKEITLREGETPSGDIVKDLSPEAVAEIQKFFQQLQSEQEKAEEDAKSEAEKSESSEESQESESQEDDKSEVGESPFADSTPDLDPGEDFKKELGQKQIEDMQFQGDHKYDPHGTY